MTAPGQKNFYMTLFSNVSRDIYEQNTYADFTVKLAQPIDMGSTSKCEISCSTFPEGVNPFLLYCNLTSPQFVADSNVRCLRTFHIDPNAMCQDEFQNVQYVAVERRIFQDIRIEFLTLEGLHIPLEDSMMPTNVVFHFRKNYQW